MHSTTYFLWMYIARQMITRTKTPSRAPKMTMRRKLEVAPRGDDLTMPAGKLMVTGADA